MPKPKGQKNQNNKAKHSKLMAQQKNKKKSAAETRKERLKAIIKKSKEQ